MQHQATTYDVIGVGFGPSNLAVAIALDDAMRRRRAGLACCFLEKQPRFVWHRDMLLPESGMQISFVKDLVTLRDPTSPFSFINYLHQKGRLESFINLKSFFPSRIEFNDYLCWAAAHFDDRCRYGEEALSIQAGDVENGEVVSLLVKSRAANGKEIVRRARNVLLAVGGRPNVPSAFKAVAADSRVFHSSGYLGSLAALDVERRPPHAVAVIGAGQSAAEIALDLHRRLPDTRVEMIFRATTLRPADDTPFVNEIFNPEVTDFVYAQPEVRRQEFLRQFRSTNYSVIDADLIGKLYEILYQQQVEGTARVAVRGGAHIVSASADARGIELRVLDDVSNEESVAHYDAVVLATGYVRELRLDLLAPIEPHLDGLEIGRDYRLRTQPGFRPKIHVQGCCEDTHGLSDTLLSVLAVRSQEIVASILDGAQQPTPAGYGIGPVPGAARAG